MPPAIHYSLSTIHCPAARYYHSTLSIWLSVDPMSDKYPSMSPYTYCANNPVKLVDPNGEKGIPTDALRANASVSDFYDMASQNSVYQRVMRRFYTQTHVYIHLGQLKGDDGTPSTKYNVARTEAPNSPNNPVGIYGFCRIIINSDILDASGQLSGDLTFVFCALLHEGFHAVRADEEFHNPQFIGYPGYQDFILNRPNDGEQHNQMAAFDRSILISGMKEFDRQNNTSHTDEWYEAVSWGGLTKTTAWNNFQKENPQLAKRYLKIIYGEINKLGEQ